MSHICKNLFLRLGVLAHQRSRLEDMKKAMAAAKERLDLLKTDVSWMDQDLGRRRKPSIRSAAISVSIWYFIKGVIGISFG